MTTPALARYTGHRFPAGIKSGSDVGNRRLEVAEVRMIEAAEVKVALRAHRASAFAPGNWDTGLANPVDRAHITSTAISTRRL